MPINFKKITPKTRKEDAAKMPMSEERYPHFGIKLEHLPEAKKWDIGKTYRVAIEIEMTGINIEDKGKYSNVSFDIKGIAILPSPTPEKVKRYTK